jgi:Na+/serine symporter
LLTNSEKPSRSGNGRKSSAYESGWVTAFVITLVGTLLGSILGLLLGIAHGSDTLATSGIVGAMFGGVPGLIIGILFASIPGLRNLGASSKFRMILLFALVGGLIGALSLLLFGNGFAMALYLAVEGAIAGGLIGAILGFSVRLFRRT